MKKRFFKSSILLILLSLSLICGALLFVSCDKPSDEGGETYAGSESAELTDNKTEDDGINRILLDGELVCKLIRGEKANDDEKKIYAALRDKINEVTGKRPSLETDFVGFGESRDENEFAIVVGKTNFAESKQLYSELGFGECKVELIERKLVLGFYDVEAALSAVERLGNALASANNGGTIVVDESMCFSVQSERVISALPGYSDGEVIAIVDGGNGSMTAVVDSTSLEAYEKYTSSLEEGGVFGLYAENVIGENRFATYTSDEHIITAIHTPATKQTRLTVELLDGNPLPSTEKESYETLCDSTLTQIGVESTGRQNGMSYVIKLADGSFMVFDGGDGRCIDLFMSAIESLADDKENITIAAWVITHIHNDHAYMLRELAKKPELVSRLKVERFIWNRPNEAHMTAIGDGLEESKELLDGMLGFEGAKVHTARAGQVFYIRNAVYTVFSTSEMLEPYVMGSYNDSCVVGLLEIDGRRIFFPGDSDRTQTKNLVKLYGEELRCDVLQVIHHGHNGGDTEAYKLFDPITVLWPVGSYRYSQEWDGNLPFSQWPCNEWFFNENSNVENIYVAGKDVVTLVIKALPRHAQ
jgi:hypothetical protein